MQLNQVKTESKGAGPVGRSGLPGGAGNGGVLGWQGGPAGSPLFPGVNPCFR